MAGTGTSDSELSDAVRQRGGYTLSLLRDLVREPSVAGGPGVARCHEVVGARLAELRLEPTILEFDGLPVTFARIGSSPAPVMFAGHLDVVPAAGKWRHPPFDLSLEGDRLYGRGVADMKAGVAAFVGALRVLADLDALDQVGVELLLTSDEEVGSARGMVPFLDAGLTHAAAAVCAEPTDLSVFHGNRGLVWATVRITGRGGHAGQAHLLSNPVPVAAKIVGILDEARFEVMDERFDPPSPSLSVTRISAATDATNVVADDVLIGIDRRLLPGEDPRAVIAELGSILEREVPSLFAVDLAIEREWPPYLIDVSEPIVRIAEESLLESGIVPSLGTDLAANDSSWLAAHGIPPILLGPGEPGLAHVTDESIRADQVGQATEVLARLALRWADEGSTGTGSQRAERLG